MLMVLGLLGFIQFPLGLLLIPLAFFGGLAFGAIGMFFFPVGRIYADEINAVLREMHAKGMYK